MNNLLILEIWFVQFAMVKLSLQEMSAISFRESKISIDINQLSSHFVEMKNMMKTSIS